MVGCDLLGDGAYASDVMCKKLLHTVSKSNESPCGTSFSNVSENPDPLSVTRSLQEMYGNHWIVS